MRGFAVWLLGLAATDPRGYRRLRRIGRAVYRPLAELRAEVIRSVEPIPFAELDRGAFRPIRPGRSFARPLESGWLRLTGEVPPEAGDDAVVLLGLRGEAFVTDADGAPLDAVSRVFIQGDLPDAGGRFAEVRGVDLGSGRVELYADVAYNGWLLYRARRGVFAGARIARRDDVVHGLYFDTVTLLVLANATDDRELARELRRALAASFRRFRAGDAAGARAELAAPLAQASDVPLTYTAIGHGHLDMAWLWPLRETRRKAARTYLRQLNNLDRRPGYRYGTSQPQQLLWMKQEHPELFARIRAAVAAGRLELQGSFWVETDTNLPGGESLVRQALVGRGFLQQEFGLTREQLRLCWLPDTFGYSGNLPQILRKSGMDWFQTIKLSWNKITVFPHRTFHWEGIDGSRVLVHMPPEGDYNSRGAADGLLRGLARYPERALGAALLVFGAGDGGGGPGELHLEITAREHDLRGLPRVEYGTASDFFRDLEARIAQSAVPSHRGELYLETHQGTYTSQARVKQLNRRAERAFHEVEALAALTGAGPEVRERLEPLWRELLLQHFHDILPGSSIERVVRESHEAFERVLAELAVIGAELEAGLPREGDAPAALNLTSFPRREHVRVGGSWYRAELGPYAAATLPPDRDAHLELMGTADSIGNGRITLRFGAHGEIVSLRDADGGEHAGEGMNRLVLHRDPFQWPYDAWDIGIGYLRRTPDVLTPFAVTTAIDGPTVVRTQRYRWRRGAIEQRIVLEAGSDLVRVETTVDWRERHRMLRAEFRPTHVGDAALCEIQFGHIERTMLERDETERAQFEVAAHKWIATQDDRAGFALLNDAKYGHRAKNGLLSLNLLRAPTFPDRTADRGEHAFSYAFRVFAPGRLEPVVADAYRLNNPLRIVPGATLPSAFGVDDAGVVIETVKPAERGTGVVVRLYESLGRPTTTALRTSIAHARAVETDLMETELGPADLAALRFGPFEIKTVLLEAA